MGEHRNTFRGYIAMLVVIKPYRGKGIGNCCFLFVNSACISFRIYLKNYKIMIALLIIICFWHLLNFAATELVTRSIKVMMESGCEEVCNYL